MASGSEAVARPAAANTPIVRSRSSTENPGAADLGRNVAPARLRVYATAQWKVGTRVPDSFLRPLPTNHVPHPASGGEKL